MFLFFNFLYNRGEVQCFQSRILVKSYYKFNIKGNIWGKNRIVRKNIKEKKMYQYLILQHKLSFLVWWIWAQEKFENKEKIHFINSMICRNNLANEWDRKAFSCAGRNSPNHHNWTKCFKSNSKLLDPKWFSQASLPSSLNILSLNRMCLSVLFKISLTH